MKKIFVTILDRQYFIGFHTSLLAWLETYAREEVDLTKYDPEHPDWQTLYHKGHKRDIHYLAKDIIPECCFVNNSHAGL